LSQKSKLKRAHSRRHSLTDSLSSMSSHVTVIYRSLSAGHPIFDGVTSGGASAAKESGHFEVRTSLSQVTRMHFFSSKKLLTLLPKQSRAIGRAN